VLHNNAVFVSECIAPPDKRYDLGSLTRDVTHFVRQLSLGESWIAAFQTPQTLKQPGTRCPVDGIRLNQTRFVRHHILRGFKPVD
jgi:hypothetical protein